MNTPIARSGILIDDDSSLFLVGNNLPAHPPALVPADHCARLIALGYISDFACRLRMTSPGRHRIAAGR